MDSSTSSFPPLPRRKHVSPTSSTSSAASAHEAPKPSRRLTLTIPPLKVKLPPRHQPPAAPSPAEDGPSNTIAVAPRLPTKIKIKPRAPPPAAPAQLVESPVAGPSVPPLPPPIVEKPKPPPRPVKLKPLREILTKLMAQIKRKDDYAFFLQPVDASQVPGYSDVVKNPMDFGTMTKKIDKGRYRSLDEFMADFRLVISNAQAFNPPDTLYYTEAARIEHYGLEQIAKASAQVIEFETDWTIDVVADSELGPSGSAGVDAMDVDDANPGKGEGETTGPSGRKRSQSVTSSTQGPAVVPSTERGRRSRKKVPMVTESWEPGGHLPGFSEGIGAFPSGSEMANIMMQLKFRGKLFRNKKEKMRFERSGIPYHPDGSLAYSLMERPFSMLSKLVPEPLSAPKLTPLIITQATAPENAEETASQAAASQPPEDRGQDELKLSGPVALPPDKLSCIVQGAEAEHPANQTYNPRYTTEKRHKHWNITRTSATRSRVRDTEESEEPPLKRLKLPEPTDYGSFAMLLGAIAAERNIRATSFEDCFGSNEGEVAFARESLNVPPGPEAVPTKATEDELVNEDVASLDAEAYIRNVVYGGTDGFAYIKSLSEFAGYPQSPTVKVENDETQGQLGMPLGQWIETFIIDGLTEGYHSVLRDAANSLLQLSQPSSINPELLSKYIASSRADKSELRATISELRRLTSSDSQIDIATLLKAPHELFVAESEWAGASYKTQREREKERQDAVLASTNAVELLALAIESHRQGEANSNATAQIEGVNGLPVTQAPVADTREIVQHALVTGADSLMGLDERLRKGELPADSSDENHDMKKARLNLIAIAKRAPIEKIAKLPPELVPPHIRHIVPTLST